MCVCVSKEGLQGSITPEEPKTRDLAAIDIILWRGLMVAMLPFAFLHALLY